jgi:hypothetical protein
MEDKSRGAEWRIERKRVLAMIAMRVKAYGANRDAVSYM